MPVWCNGCTSDSESLGLGSNPDAGARFMKTHTVAQIVFEFQDEYYFFEYDFGYDYGSDNAQWMFDEGNYGCDCNRSLFIRQQEPLFPEMNCSELIEIVDFKVVDVMV